jgi:hypothetical protein
MIAQKVPSDSMIETQGRTKALQQGDHQVTTDAALP